LVNFPVSTCSGEYAQVFGEVRDRSFLARRSAKRPRNSAAGHLKPQHYSVFSSAPFPSGRSPPIITPHPLCPVSPARCRGSATSMAQQRPHSAVTFGAISLPVPPRSGSPGVRTVQPTRHPPAPRGQGMAQPQVRLGTAPSSSVRSFPPGEVFGPTTAACSPLSADRHVAVRWPNHRAVAGKLCAYTESSHPERV